MAQFNRSGQLVRNLYSFMPQAQPGVDWNGIFQSYNDSKDKAVNSQKRQALAEALQGGDINQAMPALAAYDPQSAASVLLGQQQQQERQAWEKEKMQLQNQYDLGLIKARDAAGSATVGGSEVLASAIGAPLTGYKKYDEALLGQMAKDKAATIKGEQAVEEMRPAVVTALDRAEQAADSGSGLGRIGATLEWAGLNPAKGSGSNYSDINAANSQMNALLRQKLQASGLTGSELNSALEANAYRYTISPFDSEARIKRQIANFRRDYLGESVKTPEDYKSKYGLR